MQIHEIEMRMPTPDGQSMLAWHRTIRISLSIPHLNLRSSVLEVARVLPLLATQGYFTQRQSNKRSQRTNLALCDHVGTTKYAESATTTVMTPSIIKILMPWMFWLRIIIEIFLPLPSFSTTYTIHLTNKIRENTTEGACECCPSKENSNTPAAFMSIFSRRPIVIL